MPEKHQPVIDFLYSLMNGAAAARPGIRAAGIPAEVQEWAAQDAARQRNLAVVWADVCRKQPYAEDEDTVSYMLDFFGADLDYGWSPLVTAVICLTENLTEAMECPEMERVGMALVHLLLEAGVHPDEQEYVALYGGPLHKACAGGYLPMVRLLLRYGADPDKADVDDSTPLHWAALHNQPESTRLLLEAGATPELPDRGACTPLYWAVECQAREVEQLLRDHGATRMEFSEADWEKI